MRRGWKYALAIGGLVVAWRMRCRTPAESPPPLAAVVKVEPATLRIGDRATLTAVIAAPSGAESYQWIALEGALDDGPHGAAIGWIAPHRPGTYEVQLGVRDGERSVVATASIRVRLPPPGDADFARARIRDGRERVAARYRQLAERAAEHRAIARKPRVSIRDHYEARHALEQLGAVLVQLGEYEEALTVYEELATGEMMGARWHQYQERVGFVKYMLGDTDGALRDLKAGGPYTFGTSAHFLGTLEEQRGDLPEALASYRKAQLDARRDPEPVFREAVLAARLGATDGEIVDRLIEASPRIGGPQIVERLQSDPELAGVWRMLAASGRSSELQPIGTIPAPPDLPPTQPRRAPEVPMREDRGVAP
jgi:tetratricopeptide (TPR) repeat protein